MNTNEFERLALTFGADLGRWPEEHRAAARELLMREPALADVLAEAADLDVALTSQAPQIAPARLARLRAGILDRTAAVGFGARLAAWLTPRELLPLAAGLVLALSVTWVVGVARPESSQVAQATSPVMILLEADATGLGVL